MRNIKTQTTQTSISKWWNLKKQKLAWLVLRVKNAQMMDTNKYLQVVEFEKTEVGVAGAPCGKFSDDGPPALSRTGVRVIWQYAIWVETCVKQL